jgi:hypothetical protein
VVLSDEERREIEARLRAELEHEHEARALHGDRTIEQRDDDRRAAEIVRESEVAKLRAEVKAAFWSERGFQRYVDSRGTEHWLTPDEYERRMQRRKHRRPRNDPQKRNAALRRIAVFVGVLVLAIVIGLALGSR